MVPTIETARLRLRGFTAADHPAIAAMLSDPQVMRFIGGKALSHEEAWRRMAGIVGLWHLLGYGYWCVERKEDGLVLGQTGFADFRRAMTPSLEGMPEMGWIFAPHAHGQGYASEAVGAALEWADARLPGRDIPAIIDPSNQPSIRLAERMGFIRLEQTEYGGGPVLLLKRLAA